MVFKKRFSATRRFLQLAGPAGLGYVNRLRKKNSTKTRFKKRKGGSRTRTKRTRKREKSSGSDNGIAGDTIRIVVNAKRNKNQAGGKWLYSQFVPEIAFGNAGTQGTQGFTVATVSQLTTSTGALYNGLQNQVGLRLLNPNYLNTGSAYIPAAGVPTTDMFVISSINMEFEITSWVDISQTVDLYFYVAKVGGQDTLETYWSRGYQQQGSGKSVATYLTSPLYSGVAGYGSIAEPYAKPTDTSEYIKDAWTLKNHRTYDLSSGATQKVKYAIAMNKLVKSSELDLAAADGNFTYPGLTCWVELIVRGQLVCDTTSAINKPTFGTCRVGVTCKQSYVCHTVNSPIANRTVGIHSFNLPINTGLAQQSFIDVNDDADIVKTIP